MWKLILIEIRDRNLFLLMSEVWENVKSFTFSPKDFLVLKIFTSVTLTDLMNYTTVHNFLYHDYKFHENQTRNPFLQAFESMTKLPKTSNRHHCFLLVKTINLTQNRVFRMQWIFVAFWLQITVNSGVPFTPVAAYRPDQTVVVT